VQHGFFFDQTLCIKCHACEIACKSWNEVEIGPRWREVVKVETGTFPNVSAMNVSIACMHCGDAPCLPACPVKAITKSAEDGIVAVDEDTCIGCGFCVWACPFNAPQLSAVAGKMEKCTFCQTPGLERPLGLPRACEEVCPTGAIKSGPMTQLASQGRQRAAERLAGGAEPGVPGLMLDAAKRFGPDGGN